MKKTNIFANILLLGLVGCTTAKPMLSTHEIQCKSYIGRLGCTDQDFHLMRMRFTPERTARGNMIRIVSGEHERSLGGFLRTTDFQPRNVHELRMYTTALQCIQSKSGSFDSSVNDLIVVESASGTLDELSQHMVLKDRKYLLHSGGKHPIDIAKTLIAESVKSVDLTMINTKGTYGIFEGEVYSESRRMHERRVASLDDVKIYDCSRFKCIGSHFNGDCYIKLSYGVLVVPKSIINSSIPVILDKAP